MIFAARYVCNRCLQETITRIDAPGWADAATQALGQPDRVHHVLHCHGTVALIELKRPAGWE